MLQTARTGRLIATGVPRPAPNRKMPTLSSKKNSSPKRFTRITVREKTISAMDTVIASKPSAKNGMPVRIEKTGLPRVSA